MNLRQLQYFVAVAENESVSRAADSLNVSQSALSSRIKEMEDELGRELFSRNPRGVKLTAEGKTLFPLAVDAIQAFQRVQNAFVSEDNHGVQIALGVTPTLGAMFIPHLVSIQSLHDVRFVIRQGLGSFLFELLNLREIEAIITYSEDFGSLHPVFPLINDKLVIVGSESLLGQLKSIDRQSLSKLPYAVEPHGHGMRDKMEAYFNVGATRFAPVAELEPFEARRALVLDGQVCAVVPRWLFDRDIAEGRTSYRELNIEQLSLNMSVIISNSLRKDVRSILLRSITSVLDKMIADQPTWTKRYASLVSNDLL